MRNLLALLAAFTLSTSTAVTAVACGTSEQTTTVIFDWNGVINGKHNETATDFFERLLANQNAGIGQTLYKDIVDYVSLSILKTNPIFTNEFQFAKQSVENQIKNIQDSLRAKYGRKWETQWRNFLKDPDQGGDGQTGSYQRYFDVLLKGQANTIVSQYYVGNNYHNFQYYSSTEISIWLSDMHNQIYNNGWTMNKYQTEGIYKNKVWIVANSVDKNAANPIESLNELIKNTPNVADIQLKYKIPKTIDDQQSNDGYLTDPSSTIKGLLSDQQVKIAQVWMKSQGPIWARQIIIPFDTNKKETALKVAITENSFEENKNKIQKVINDINTVGFEAALQAEMGSIKSVTSSSQTGDLGLVTLNSDSSNIKASFSYYLYRYVTSNQGIGQNNETVAPYNLSQYTNTSNPSSLFDLINRTSANKNDQTSSFNDLVWMKDEDTNNKYSGTAANGTSDNKVAIFIDADGIHFIQTPGISYNSTVATEATQDIIVNYTQLLSNPSYNITWNDVQKLADRPGGLTNTPYLDFLQTQYLYWNAKNWTTYFDLNESLSKFTSGSADVTSDIWWDYILYFNKNIDNINWNLSEALGNDNINAPANKIEEFVKAMKTWFLETNDRRLNRLQGTSNTETLIKNILDWNKNLDDINSPDVPVARLDASDISYYLTNVAAETIWWYDPNSIN